MKRKTAILLVNLGTPDSPKTLDVGSYLFQFLNDKRVIDIPWFLRKILVNLLNFLSFLKERNTKYMYGIM